MDLIRIKSAAEALYSMVFGKLNLLLFVTNRCNSRCNICGIWEQEKIDLPLEVIKDIFKSKLVNKQSVVLEGGEAILHPDIEKILNFLYDKDINYTLLTNGLLTEKLQELTMQFKIPAVSISFDGCKETYKQIRGIDGHNRVCSSLIALRELTNVSACFTISPGNTYEDYKYVKHFCERWEIRLMTNIYCELEYSGKIGYDKPIDARYDQHESPFIALYNKWQRGEVQMPCSGLRYMCNIYPNGDVSLCQPMRNVIIGNVLNTNLDKVWKEGKSTRHQYRKCNACWVSCNRYIDGRIWKLFHRSA